MNRRWTTIAVVGLVVLCPLGLATVELLRDPLADIDDEDALNDVSGDAPPVMRADAVADRDSPHAKYLGSQACAECHADICESYQSHPMSHSMSLANEAPSEQSYAEAGEFFAPREAELDLRMAYDVERTSDEVLHCERADDLEGNLLCSRKVPVQYAVGSGKRGHSYLRSVDGQLYMSPITWYTGADNWDLSPGYQVTNQHFERRVVDGCVACHVGRVAPDPATAHTFEAEPFLELSIGCERCHGPGSDHVAFHKQVGDLNLDSDPIVNPSRLDQPLRDDVCLQCHLQGIARTTHPGRSDFDFQPGEAIADTWTVFMHGAKVAADNTTQAVGQAEQMLASRCYNESDGAMSCTSCHDPHASPSEAIRVEFYRSKCLVCHEHGDSIDCLVDQEVRLRRTDQDSCIVCHMPKLAANDVPHTSQTDHRVIRQAGGETEVSEPLQIDTYESDRIPADIVDRAQGIFLSRQPETISDRLAATRSIDLLTPWVKRHPDDEDALSALGTLHSLVLDTASAIAAFEQALEAHPNSEQALRGLTYLYHDLGDLENGIRYGRRLVAINPNQFEYHGRLAHMLGRNNQMPAAIASALKAADIEPWNPQIHGWLADAYRLTAQPELAEQHQQLYEKLRPHSAETELQE